MFELLTNGVVEDLCRKMDSAGVKYGFGGIAQIGTGTLPAEKILIEHYRLKSTRVILSRGFCKITNEDTMQTFAEKFEKNIKQFRSYEKLVSKLTNTDRITNHKDIEEIIDTILEKQGVCHV